MRCAEVHVLGWALRVHERALVQAVDEPLGDEEARWNGMNAIRQMLTVRDVQVTVATGAVPGARAIGQVLAWKYNLE